eukprot:TRINITY_DN55873_c0_g1_i1.p1 TRINITY_DN55873_c0_g1~~TRINITY_DN55873_c0_g1_i1.p1  ORF type:complete len:443 (+),score=87.90 TRINITY_DN55873_c0_g1_i1:121-1329(+)
MTNMQRTPTFVVEKGDQLRVLDAMQRREQHFDEDYKRNKPLCFNARAYQKTHPAKVGRTDADATYVAPMMLGVADGVSQIEDFGIDPSELPQELLSAAGELCFDQLFPAMNRQPVDYKGPIPLMLEAFESTECLGSTTVLLSILDNSTKIHGKLHPMIAVISIGDCEVIVLRRIGGAARPLETVFHTEMQRIDGNAQAPLQVARVDERVDENFEDSITLDVIERGSAVHCLSAYEGDIIIQGSDGVFDNLFVDEIVNLANEYLPPARQGKTFIPDQPAVLEQLARRIVAESHKKTQRGPGNDLPISPIGRGGKVDDTCCVVGQVIEWTEQHNEVWSRARAAKRQRDFLDRLFCSIGFGNGFLCGSTEASDHGSDYGSEYGDTDNGASGSIPANGASPVGWRK